MAVAADPRELELAPTLDEVRELAREHTLVPLRHTFIADCETPVSAYLKLRGGGPVVPARVGRAGPALRALVVPRRSARAASSASTTGGSPWTASERDADDPYAAGRPRSSAATAPPRSRACRRSPAARSGCSATTWCARPSPPSASANADDTRRARPGADGLRRAGGLRPPAPRGDGAGQRVRGRRRGAPPTRDAAAAIADVRERLAAPVPRARAGRARARRVRARTSARRATPRRSSGPRSTSARATSTRWCRASAGAPTARWRRSRSTAACAP